MADVFNRLSLECFGNASSIHRLGQRARQQLEIARQTLSFRLGAKPSEFVFTSGGTESNNLALAGVLRSLAGRKRHVITSTIEHPAVSEVLRALVAEGVEVSYAPVDAEGRVEVETVRALVRPETVLISVMHANNETGVLQPLAEIADLVSEIRRADQQIYFHADGVQAFGKIDVRVSELGVDLYSVSGHKLYAPKGIGGLYVRSGTPLAALHLGGRHERSRRAGTENVPAAAAFAKAIELCTADDSAHVLALRCRFESELHDRFPAQTRINGISHPRLPNTANIEFSGVSGEALVISLDMEGIAVSTGSACSSGSVEPSPVLLAMGRSRKTASSALRFSFGRFNTEADISTLVAALERCVSRTQKRVSSEREARAVLS